MERVELLLCFHLCLSFRVGTVILNAAAFGFRAGVRARLE